MILWEGEVYYKPPFILLMTLWYYSKPINLHFM